jgi:hypothetical protein
VTLDDVRIVKPGNHYCDREQRYRGNHPRPMTLADLVEIGEGLGGEVQDAAYRGDQSFPTLMASALHRRYLLIPLGEEP